MRIKFLTSIAGANYSHRYGEEVEWRDEAEAQRFIAAGYAIELKPATAKAAKPEKADGKSGDEDADAPPAKKRGGKGGSKADGKSGDEDADGK